MRSVLNRLVMNGVRAVRRVVVAVVGSTVVGVGLVLVFVPGPALVVVPIGLGILALEFTWARRLLKRARELYPAAAPKPSSADIDARAESRGQSFTSEPSRSRPPKQTDDA